MSYENAALMSNVHVLGLDCGGSSGQGWDNNPCTKMDISTNSASAESTSISSFCYGVGPTCQSDVLSYNKKLTLRAPGVVLTKYFVSGSKVPKVMILIAKFCVLSGYCKQKGLLFLK